MRATDLCLALLTGLAGLAAGCEPGYRQGDCEIGYLDVGGECTLAVGPACEDGGDCLTGLCATDEQGRRFCTLRCREDAGCPAEFYCATWSDRRCYPGQRPPPCLVDADCGPCLACLEGHCLAVPGCQTCQQDGDCGACGRCDQGVCVAVAGCVPCAADADCPTCELCSGGRCARQPGCLLCASDLDCPGCTRCERGGCALIPGCGVDPCFNDLDCPARTRCMADSLSGLRVCLPSQLAYGADCTRGGEAQCAEAVCLQVAPSAWACSRACAAPGDCPAGASCEPDADCLFACRAPASLPPGGPCEADRDCLYGSLCGLVPASDGLSWQPRCKAPLLCAGAAGEACAPEDARRGRCQSGVCSQLGACTSVCASDFDCPAGSRCAALSAPLPGGLGPAPYLGCAAWDAGLGEVGEPCPRGDPDCRAGACLSPAHGGYPVCTAACTPGLADCPDGFTCDPALARCLRARLPGACRADAECPAGEACGLAENGAALACGAPAPEGLPPGAPCGSGADCAAGLCTALGLCAAACRDSADCPAGLGCDLAELGLPGGARGWALVCGPPLGSLAPCRRPADCAAGETCSLWPTPWEHGFQGRCVQPWAGGAAPGAACQAPGDCAALVCDLGGLCGQVCLADADCPADFTCALVLTPAPWGAAHLVQSCAPLSAGLGQPHACVFP